MQILSRPQTIWGRSPDNQVELSEWETACFKHWCLLWKWLNQFINELEKSETDECIARHNLDINKKK